MELPEVKRGQNSRTLSKKSCPKFTHEMGNEMHVDFPLLKILCSMNLGIERDFTLPTRQQVLGFDIEESVGHTDYTDAKQSKQIESINQKGNGCSRENNIRLFVDDEIATHCPFCDDSFFSGSQFSKHLLRCKKRRSSVKNRSPALSKRRDKMKCNMQASLLTGGGRHLPGYPKIT